MGPGFTAAVHDRAMSCALLITRAVLRQPVLQLHPPHLREQPAGDGASMPRACKASTCMAPGAHLRLESQGAAVTPWPLLCWHTCSGGCGHGVRRESGSGAAQRGVSARGDHACGCQRVSRLVWQDGYCTVCALGGGARLLVRRGGEHLAHLHRSVVVLCSLGMPCPADCLRPWSLCGCGGIWLTETG